jgi:formate dehydrogenase subunit gamma
MRFDVATTRRLAAEPPLLRFDVRTRVLHWVNAALFAVVMLTGAALYAGPISTFVGHRDLVRDVHVYAGFAIPVALVLALIGRGGARARADLGRLNRWQAGDGRWFRRRNRASVRLGKFNPGQKLNAAFIAGAGLVMLATGSIMHWFDAFPLDWRTGATFVHDWFALGIWVAVIGHVVLAVRDGDALEAMMVNGRVPATWAARRAPRWYDEERPPAAPGPNDIEPADTEPDDTMEAGESMDGARP